MKASNFDIHNIREYATFGGGNVRTLVVVGGTSIEQVAAYPYGPSVIEHVGDRVYLVVLLDRWVQDTIDRLASGLLFATAFPRFDDAYAVAVEKAVDLQARRAGSRA